MLTLHCARMGRQGINITKGLVLLAVILPLIAIALLVQKVLIVIVLIFLQPAKRQAVNVLRLIMILNGRERGSRHWRQLDFKLLNALFLIVISFVQTVIARVVGM